MGMTAVIHVEQMVANTCCASRGRCAMLISSLLLLLAAIATTTTIATCNAFVPILSSSSRSIDGTRTSVRRVCRDMDIIEFSAIPILLEQQQQQQQQEESNTINSSSSNSYSRIISSSISSDMHKQYLRDIESNVINNIISRSNSNMKSILQQHLSDTTSTIPSTKDEYDLDRNEQTYLDTLEEWYDYSQKKVKCPFFRRRCGDILDRVERIVRLFLIRPYCSDSSHRNLGPLMAYRSSSALKGDQKTKNLPVQELLGILRKDWRALEETETDIYGYRNKNDDGAYVATTTDRVDEKGYYVTGKISKRIYRDDCEFQSPDPDLPLKGIRKYVGVASQLFHSKTSFSKLLSLEQQQQQNEDNNSTIVLKATWKMSLTISLPWKPQVSEFTGSTLYFLDEDRLVFRHQETWDISVWDAFLDMINVRAKIVNIKSNININENNNKNSNSNKKKSQCPLALFFPTNKNHRNLQQSYDYSSLSTNSTASQPTLTN